MRSNEKPAAIGSVRPVSGSDPVLDAAAAAFEAEHGDGPGAALVVVIAAFNEAGSVGEVVRSVPANIAGQEVDCIVVDDGSGDGTAAEAREAGALVCRLEQNRGQGRALGLGYRLAAGRGARLIATLDADGQFDPGELPGLVVPILEDRADFMNGSRRLGRSESNDAVRRTGVVFFGWLISRLTGTVITDPANGLRVFRTEVVETVPLRQPQYQTAELLIGALALGFRVKEAPVTVRRRATGASKKGSNLRYGYRFGRVVLGTWWWFRTRSGPGRPLPPR